jgi:hypothetical protein
MSQEAEAPETVMVEASTAAVATVAATEAVVDEAAIIMVAVESTGTTEAASRAHHLSSLRHPAHLATRVETEARAQAERR